MFKEQIEKHVTRGKFDKEKEETIENCTVKK